MRNILRTIYRRYLIDGPSAMALMASIKYRR